MVRQETRRDAAGRPVHVVLDSEGSRGPMLPVGAFDTRREANAFAKSLRASYKRQRD